MKSILFILLFVGSVAFGQEPNIAISPILSVSYSAGNFTVGGAGTWTVDAGDQVSFAYSLIGRIMTVYFYIGSTDLSNTNTYLRITIPASKTASHYTNTECMGVNAGGNKEAIDVFVETGTTFIRLQRLGGSDWAVTSSDNTAVACSFTFVVN